MRAKTDKRKQAAARKEAQEVEQWRNLIILLAILLLTVLIYSNSLHNGFIYFDDPELVVDNLSIRQFTWDNMVHFFTTPFQFTYLPVGLISYAIDYQIGQLDPFIYHLDSLLAHLATIILVYLLFQKMTEKSTMSLFMAAIFAIHPVSVDNVDWVATRNNILATLFFLGALLSYTYYIKSNFKLRYLALAVLSFVLSCLSKSSSVVLPLVLFLWDYYYDRKVDRNLFLDKIPFVLISLTLGILTLNIRQDVVPPTDYNLLDRFIIFCSALADYFYRMLFPFHLSMSYAYPAKDGAWLPLYLYLSPFILILIGWGLYKLGVPRKILIIGLAFFFLNIFLSQSVLLIDNYKASRYVYLSYIGLFFILAWFNDDILSASEGWKARLKFAWIGMLVVFVAGFSYLTYYRNFVWKDTIALFDDVIAKEPDIPWVYTNRGIAKYKNNNLTGAMDDFNYALQLDSNFALARYYHGVLNYVSGNDQEALADLDQTVALVPTFANAYNDRGKVKMTLQDYPGALEDLATAISLDSYFAEAYVNRGNARDDTNDHQGAIDDYSWAIYYNPDYTIAYYYRGLSKSILADYQGALDDFSIAIDLDPNYANAFYMRGIARQNLNDPAGSCDDIKKALSLGYQPDVAQGSPNCP